MFGSSNNQSQPSDNPAAPPTNSGISSFTMDPPLSNSSAIGGGLPSEPTASPVPDATTAPHLDEPASQPDSGAPSLGDNSSSDSSTGLPNAIEPSPSASASAAEDSSPTNDDLISIKQKALTELSPIVQHLDQSPEEKFKTLMMMIQANDNQSLIKDAYAAAEQITDEKAKSQALLDVVNEINYFTQKDKKD